MRISIENLSFVYMQGTPFEKKALDDINFSIESGEFVAIIGHTGSGKSTLIQQLNGLLRPSAGKIFIGDTDITLKQANLTDIRKQVGLVFQYPEYQLFEETVEKDISFGPVKLGLNKEEVKAKVMKAMMVVGLDYNKFKDKSPFELSGGEKRRVAIAGVLAMEPSVLILDEPTASLDPRGRDEILSEIKKMHTEYDMTIILVSHSMEEVAKVASRIIVISEGKVILDGRPGEVFNEIEILHQAGLGVPQISYLAEKLRNKGIPMAKDTFKVQDAKEQLLNIIRGKTCD